MSRSGDAVALNGHVLLRCSGGDNARKLFNTHWNAQAKAEPYVGGEVVKEEEGVVEIEGYMLHPRVKHLGPTLEAVLTNRGDVECKHSLL